jgi:DNA topoisomerase IB
VTPQQATAEVFYTAFKALSKQEQENVLARIARDRKLRRILEHISDLLVIEEGRDKPSRPLRDYIDERERRERAKAKAGR